MKKRGFGKGRWNGFGGKVKNNETKEESVKREVFEESNLEIPICDFKKLGVVEFSFQESSVVLENHFFKVNNFLGEPVETNEMKPKWFHVDEIPFNQMWPDDIYWMSLFLKDKKFKGRFLFDRPSDETYSSNIIEKSIEEVIVF